MPHAQRVTLAHELRMACIRVARKVRYEATGMAPHQFSTLAAIERGEANASALAAREQVSAASMSRTLRELVDHGLVSRTPHPSDGRQLVLSLTPAGEQVLAEGRRQRDSWMSRQLDGCSEQEREVLARAAQILNRMVCEENR